MKPNHDPSAIPGRIRPAPEGFFTQDEIARASKGRRQFMAKALAAGAGAVATQALAGENAKGDPAILTLPPHSTGLGQPVASTGYGSPSKYESNLQRRQSPGLTQVAAASVSFCPLQGLLAGYFWLDFLKKLGSLSQL